MTEVVLWGLSTRGEGIEKDTDLSVLVSRDIRPFEFSLATTGAATDGFEHESWLYAPLADSDPVTYSHGRTGPRQVPDDHSGKSRGSLARVSRPVFLPPGPHSFHLLLGFLGAAQFFYIRVLKYHG